MSVWLIKSRQPTRAISQMSKWCTPESKLGSPCRLRHCDYCCKARAETVRSLIEGQVRSLSSSAVLSVGMVAPLLGKGCCELLRCAMMP